ncbi:unnamed protein product [Mytilus edulis]|uniref:Uncharacterized protein n=1 Tax=Mytilus edulis TaxID=6550 RepID=A0A8S3TPV2_MYTED|nr:unnamed protein product [Mytilus edulis]
MNVSNIKSTEPDDLSASVLIMNKHEKEEEEFPTEFIKKVKRDESIFGFKDNIVKCEHCTHSFSCKNCTSKLDHIRRLDQALKMKDQTIQRLEMALTKREKDIIEEPDEDTTKTPTTATTAEIELTGEPEHKKRKTAITSDIENLEDNQTEDGSKSLNQLVVDMKQALQKLGEIPLLDHYIDIYKKYMKNIRTEDEFTTTDENYGTDIRE